MESEDDMHDANDMESVDEDFYSDGDGYGGDALDSDGDDADYDFMGNESDDSNDQAVSRSQVLKFAPFHPTTSSNFQKLLCRAVRSR